MRPIRLKLADVEFIAFQLAKYLMEWDEPIPSFDTRFPQTLESCLITPFQKYEGKFLNKGLFRKGAVLFYLMIKNHPFQNGNKRIAVTTLLVFLATNRFTIHVSNQSLYKFARYVAGSRPTTREHVIKEIENYIRSNSSSTEPRAHG